MYVVAPIHSPDLALLNAAGGGGNLGRPAQRIRVLCDVGDVCHEEHRWWRHLVGGAEPGSWRYLQRACEKQADRARVGSVAGR